MKFTNVIQNLYRDESGATAIEYGLIAALIAVAIIGALSTLEGGLSSIFSGVGTKLSTEAGNI
ncbi:Flp family type IVb pilin [Ferruginivarius sediminum]|uniref:Flp family type IVb pilin n=1 Tax=Ferruginivarius sediminum TaxID=2661937 RepID=A0A369TEZ3_9PROT|nr:Flp family type IVb pilin [Ferruginivarius sediminum]RDD62687.1 Flp family type IVb pilin [Ferruginivarius sediminum]